MFSLAPIHISIWTFGSASDIAKPGTVNYYCLQRYLLFQEVSLVYGAPFGSQFG